MEKEKLIILGSLGVLLIVFTVTFFIIIGEEKPKAEFSQPPLSSESLSKKEEATQKITLYFPSEDGMLHPEEREIPAELSFIQRVKQTIQELIQGSQNDYISPFPANTKLRELYITDRGILYVDFSRELKEKHPSGSAAEISTVFSVVNSIIYNFNQINEVFVLIGGEEKQTLKGHIDLSKPFLPRKDLIAK